MLHKLSQILPVVRTHFRLRSRRKGTFTMTFRWQLFIGGIVSLILSVFTHGVNAQPKPSQPAEIRITARRFEFDPHTITLQKGQPAKLVITSEDVDHGFAIEEFNVNVKIPAKQTKVVEFTPD